jgi:hypothetical protein
MSTMVMKLEHQEQREKPPYLARVMSKWFYDTSTGIALEQPTVVFS